MNAYDLDSMNDLDWTVRAFVYTFIVENERPPSVDEAAVALGLTHERAEIAYQRLNRRHALFLDPGTAEIRMAHPFSGIPTPFRVRANGHVYWANCAWDMLGVPAALHADAEIEAHITDAHQTRVTLSISGNQLHGHGELVHFPLAFRHWYDDLIAT